ncbi:MAG: hypothetical protein JWN99_2428 [Ilumatobacteraceae bacterium]|nr:hypothetical protein [Ilumatobacteraceae bacterium]
MLVALVLVFALAVPTSLPPVYGGGGSSNGTPPPVVLVGARSVSTRNATGGLRRESVIPTTSAVATFGGGPAATCTFTADHDDFELANGDRVPMGTVIIGYYQFVQGANVTLPLIPATLPPPTVVPPSAGSLDQATIVFTVYCAGAPHDLRSREFIQVPILDPFLDPRLRIPQLRNLLQLDQPTVFTNPIVGTYGGLVTRYPTWLAITPDAWFTQQSNSEVYRGTTLLLIAQPRELDFLLDFTPNPDKPSKAFHGVIDCVPNAAPVEGGGALPAFPVLPDQTEPGVNGDCEWTPPGPGTVTITARITYTITFWANGYTEPDDDYIWASEPAAYLAGELTAVNTKPKT